MASHDNASIDDLESLVDCFNEIDRLKDKTKNMIYHEKVEQLQIAGSKIFIKYFEIRISNQTPFPTNVEQVISNYIQTQINWFIIFITLYTKNCFKYNQSPLSEKDMNHYKVRSGLQFFIDEYKRKQGCQELLHDFRETVRTLFDTEFEKWLNSTCAHIVNPNFVPKGIPHTHWWWWWWDK